MHSVSARRHQNAQQQLSRLSQATTPTQLCLALVCAVLLPVCATIAQQSFGDTHAATLD